MRRPPIYPAFLLVMLLTIAACGSGDPKGGSAQREADRPVANPPARQQATVLLGADFAGAWPTGLDPATNVTGGANLSLMNAIYGGLLQLTANDDGSNPRVIGALASGYEMAEDGRALVIRLRPGVTFSDGTVFDAEAVKAGMERNLTSGCPCAPLVWPWVAENRVTAPDEHTVVLHFSRPYGAVVNTFPVSTLNWIPSPKALKEMGETAFRVMPVGAGPFRVVSNQLSSRLELERNPRYWQKDRPYLDRLVFQTIATQQAGYQALLAGDAQAYEAMSSPLLIEQAQANKQLAVNIQPPTSPGVIQLNTRAAPFDKLQAREAIYFATNVQAIRRGIFKDQSPISQSFTAEGGLFYHAMTPGYRPYDLQKARALVKELGGLQITLGTLRSEVSEQIVTALQSQWREAGIEAKIDSYDIATLVGKFQSGAWQAMVQTAGSYDPEAGVGLNFRFGSTGPLSGVKDADLDTLILKAAGEVDAKERDRLYVQAAIHISDKAYAPFLVAFPFAHISRGLRGPGLTTKIPPILVTTAIAWQDVRLVSQ